MDIKQERLCKGEKTFQMLRLRDKLTRDQSLVDTREKPYNYPDIWRMGQHDFTSAHALANLHRRESRQTHQRRRDPRNNLFLGKSVDWSSIAVKHQRPTELFEPQRKGQGSGK